MNNSGDTSYNISDLDKETLLIALFNNAIVSHKEANCIT
jgi:hypothetical protein